MTIKSLLISDLSSERWGWAAGRKGRWILRNNRVRRVEYATWPSGSLRFRVQKRRNRTMQTFCPGTESHRGLSSLVTFQALSAAPLPPARLVTVSLELDTLASASLESRSPRETKFHESKTWTINASIFEARNNP